MHARLTRFEGSPERIDDAVRQSQDVWLPKLRAIDGFQGVNTLADRSTGTIVSITYWESEDAMRASEEKVSAVRKDVADAIAVRAQPTARALRGRPAGLLAAAQRRSSAVRRRQADRFAARCARP